MITSSLLALSAAIAEMQKSILDLTCIPDDDYALVLFRTERGPSEVSEEKIQTLKKKSSAIFREEDMHVKGDDIIRECVTEFLHIPRQPIVKILTNFHSSSSEGFWMASGLARELAGEGKLVFVLFGGHVPGSWAHIYLPFTGEHVRKIKW